MKKIVIASVLLLAAFALFSIKTVVSDGNQPPIASFTYQTSSILQASFDGRASYDPDGTIVSYSWNYGDEYYGSGSAVTHTYSNLGNYTATLTVTDNGGAIGSQTKTVNCCGGDGGI